MIDKWIVALTVMLPTLMVIVDTSVVNVSLDHIRGSLSAGITEATWSITSYLAANAVIIPMTGWLSRFFGRRRYLIFSIALFTISSLLCGTAWSIQSLIFFRILQGLAGGALQPLSQAILLETFPPIQHGMAMAVFGAGIMFGPIIGPVLGGWITDNWSWQWIFFINIPIGIISIFMSMLFIVDPPYMQRGEIKIDYIGLALLAVGIGCLQIVLDQGQREDWFESGFIIWLCALSVISMVVLVLVELSVKHPIVDLRSFKDLSFTAGNIVVFFALLNLFGSIVLLPIYVQNLMGYTATLSGIVLGPGGIANLIAMPIAGRLVNRISPKILLGAGIIVTAYSTWMMSNFNLLADFDTILWPRVIMGIGMGFVFIPLTTLTLSSIRKEEMGNATSIYNLVRNIGGSFGVALVSTMLARRAQVHQAQLAEHLTWFDPGYVLNSRQITQFLQQRMEHSAADQGTAGVIYEGLLRHSSMMAFNDVFIMLCIMFTMVLPLIFLMGRKKRGP